MQTLLPLAVALAPLLAAPQDAPARTTTLPEARKGFTTQHVDNAYEADGPAATPPEGVLEVVRYASPAGELVAYRTPDPGDGAKHPAIVWAHGGFGGIGAWLWEEDGPLAPFLAQGFVVFCPSWRGENDNPGAFELFYGEVDDALAAVDHVAALPWVDPARVYMVGHDTGATITMLAALCTTKLRAAVAFGGAPDLWSVVGDGEGYGNTPYDIAREEETRLRSPIHFVASLRTPLLYFEGEAVWTYVEDALRMEQAADAARAPFDVCVVPKADHFDYLGHFLPFAAELLARDTAPESAVRLAPDAVAAAQQAFLAERLAWLRAEQLETDEATYELLAELGALDPAVDTRLVFRLVVYYDGAPLQAAAARLKELAFELGEVESGTDGDGDAFFKLAAYATVKPTLENVHARSVQVMEVADDAGVGYLAWAKAR